jgi:hypothetical protein
MGTTASTNSMKCRQCGKEIPNGFTDCPWCGATAGLGAGSSPAAPPEYSSTTNLLIAMSIVTSALLFFALNYFATLRSSGPFTLETSGYFLLRCAGALVLGVLLVFGYKKLRGKSLRGQIQLLVMLTLASLFSLVALAIPTHTRLKGIDPATVRKYSDVVKATKKPKTPPVNKTKWDPAARSLMQDVQARNQQYVSEISALDETAKPLYTPESFRDPATIQQMIDQLHARLAVADKYSDWQPVFSKMQDYVATVDATDDEKRKFMQSFNASLPKTLAVCKEISGREHAWLLSSLDLYQFALSKEGSFLWRPDNLIFQKRADSNAFRQKFLKARALNMQFLQAYWQVKQAQDAMMAQLGLQDVDATSAQPN